MIARGCSIVIDNEGGSQRVESLRVGDTVLNPFGGTLDRITMIEKHRVLVAGAMSFRKGLMPCILRKHCLSKVAPASDTVLSADQIVSVVLKDKDFDYPVVTQLRVSALTNHITETEAYQKAEVEYFEIALKFGHQIVVNNLLCNVETRAVRSLDKVGMRII